MPGKGRVETQESVDGLYGPVEHVAGTGCDGGHGFDARKEQAGAGQLAICVEDWTGVAADVDPCVHQMLVVDAGTPDRGGGNETAGCGDFEGDVGGGLEDGMYHAFDLDPLAIFGSGEQAVQGDRLGADGEVRGPDDGDMGLVKDGCEVAGRADAGDIDKRVRVGRALARLCLGDAA